VSDIAGNVANDDAVALQMIVARRTYCNSWLWDTLWLNELRPLKSPYLSQVGSPPVPDSKASSSVHLHKIGEVRKERNAAFGRRRSADAANREAYEEYSRHYCSGDGGHAGGR